MLIYLVLPPVVQFDDREVGLRLPCAHVIGQKRVAVASRPRETMAVASDQVSQSVQ